MPLMPKRVKHRKVQRGNNAGLSQRCNKLDFGDFGLQTFERGFLTAAQIEAARVAITRHMKRRGQVWIRLFPYKRRILGRPGQAWPHALRDLRLLRDPREGGHEPRRFQAPDPLPFRLPDPGCLM